MTESETKCSGELQSTPDRDAIDKGWHVYDNPGAFASLPTVIW